MNVPKWMQTLADELAEAAVGTPEAAEALIALGDVLLPLERVPGIGPVLEVGSDIALRLVVEWARDAWVSAQDEDSRKARLEERDPFVRAAEGRMAAGRRLRRARVLGFGVRLKPREAAPA